MKQYHFMDEITHSHVQNNIYIPIQYTQYMITHTSDTPISENNTLHRITKANIFQHWVKKKIK